jgi:hypothetical protein
VKLLHRFEFHDAVPLQSFQLPLGFEAQLAIAF